jgi:hypothetical protein
MEEIYRHELSLRASAPLLTLELVSTLLLLLIFVEVRRADEVEGSSTCDRFDWQYSNELFRMFWIGLTVASKSPWRGRELIVERS